MQYFKKAQWIWCSEAAEVNAYVVFNQEFDYQAGSAPAILRISALISSGDRYSRTGIPSVLFL